MTIFLEPSIEQSDTCRNTVLKPLFFIAIELNEPNSGLRKNRSSLGYISDLLKLAQIQLLFCFLLCL